MTSLQSNDVKIKSASHFFVFMSILFALRTALGSWEHQARIPIYIKKSCSEDDESGNGLMTDHELG
jgi:hypothetical protein